jgi:mevalonate kinase
MKELAYPSKLLLFGEYAIIKGGRALAIPFPRFSGHWAWAQHGTSQQESLRELAFYLGQLQQSGNLKCSFDQDAFLNDLDEGLYFHSDIPRGYGVGSSGALTAAVFDRYCTKNSNSGSGLKSVLAQIESFFHGASSGVDPLVCQTKDAIVLEGSNLFYPVVAPASVAWKSGGLFLLDTGQSRETGPLVERFLEWCKDPVFDRHLRTELLPANSDAIQAYLDEDVQLLWDRMETISRFQWKYFYEMIPESIKPYWFEGLDRSQFFLKLCGAGGGGFMLGATQDKDQLMRQLPAHQLIWI